MKPPFSPERRPYRTARERVAARRAALGQAAPRRKSLLIPGVALLLVALLVVGLWSWIGGTLRAFQQEDPRQSATDTGTAAFDAGALPRDLRQPFNVLLIGVDRRPDPEEGARSDTLILVHVNPAEGWAGMLSIPRDSVVQIPRLGTAKINAAYAHGYNNAEALYGAGVAPEAAGGALAAETVAGFLGVKVDYIAQVDFRGFQRLVDTLGGIPVDVERPIFDATYPSEDYGYERLYIPAGLQVMNGDLALRYARTRHASSDFDRSRRQQQVLRAILYEVRARGLLSQATLLPELVRDLQESVSTTLPLSDLDTLRGLAALAQRLDGERILTLSINPNDVGIVWESGSDIYWDPADVAAQVARLQAGPGAEVEQARVQVLNGAGVPGLAGRVTARLSAQGFSLADPGDAPRIYERSQLIDYRGRPETLRRLVETLGLDPGDVFTVPPPGSPPGEGADLVLILGENYQPAWAGE
ncbi:MAG: LCP family protein [Chloroflexaceae bacterium]|nr:LCP family protein [Chloroflexaceae bacterium]